MTPPTTRKKPERRTNPLSRERVVDAAVDPLDAAGESGLTFRATERHPWLAPQITAQLAHNPTGPVAARVFEDIGRQGSAPDGPTSSRFSATSALMHYLLGAAGQNAANLERARSLGPEADRNSCMDTVADAWKQLSPEDYPFTRAIADHGLDHDDRTRFLAGIDLISQMQSIVTNLRGQNTWAAPQGVPGWLAEGGAQLFADRGGVDEEAARTMTTDRPGPPPGPNHSTPPITSADLRRGRVRGARTARRSGRGG